MTSIAATGGVGAAMAHADRGEPTTNLAAAAPGATVPPATQATVAPAGTPTTAPKAGAQKYADGTWTGPAEFTRFGNVQVQVTISAGKIVAIEAVQIPSERRSASINGRAQPILESEAIAAQGANLDIVSGATYTSRTYAASLQAALDAAAQKSTTTGRA